MKLAYPRVIAVRAALPSDRSFSSYDEALAQVPSMVEPMAWPPRDEQGLATALAELAGAIAYPPTPPIAAAVGAELREHPARRSPGALPWAWRA